MNENVDKYKSHEIARLSGERLTLGRAIFNADNVIREHNPQNPEVIKAIAPSGLELFEIYHAIVLFRQNAALDLKLDGHLARYALEGSENRKDVNPFYLSYGVRLRPQIDHMNWACEAAFILNKSEAKPAHVAAMLHQCEGVFVDMIFCFLCLVETGDAGQVMSRAQSAALNYKLQMAAVNEQIANLLEMR